MPVEPWNEPWNKPWDGPYIENGTPVAYGYPVPVIDYWDPSSIARQNLSSVAREAHAWTVLNITECQAQYLSCTPRTTYGDVAVIVETGTLQSAGWTRSELFNFQASSNLSSYWDLLIPPGSINSLWFSAQCSTRRQLSGSGREDTCRNICLGALGSDLSFDPGSEDDTWAGFPVLDFSAQKFPPPQDPWFLNFHGAIGQHENSTLYKTHGFNAEFDPFRVRHCLAKPKQPSCKVGVSNALLLVVLGCVFIKTLQATIVVWKLTNASLVTPGDAIDSFISSPDPRTMGLCTLDIIDSERLGYGRRKRWTPDIHGVHPHTIYARKRRTNQCRLAAAITSSPWVRTYAILASGFILLTAALGVSNIESDIA
ncbi:hypothetical protein CIB48_g7794, partial [Xylaria polymorpha]